MGGSSSLASARPGEAVSHAFLLGCSHSAPSAWPCDPVHPQPLPTILRFEFSFLISALDSFQMLLKVGDCSG